MANLQNGYSTKKQLDVVVVGAGLVSNLLNVLLDNSCALDPWKLFFLD